MAKNKGRFHIAIEFLLLALLILFLGLHGMASAQVPFYQGKTITIIQGTAPGGSSDMLTRSMMPFLQKHIPGNPTIVSEYMPGGGGHQSCQSYL